MSASLCGRKGTTEYLFTMKRFYSLFLILCMVLGAANVAEAQEVPVQRTRYVYLWDVTGSIKPKGKGKATDPNSGLYSRIYGYLRDDISSKPNDTEIIVIPFNDNVVGEYEFEMRDGRVVAKDTVEFADLGISGAKMIDDHADKFQKNKFVKDPDAGGFTDIAKSLKWAERYIEEEWNTIFVLLTDGGQEYTDDRTIETKGDEARVYLQNAISNFDKKMGNATTFNMLFYVITVDDKDSPREKEMSLNKTRFIHAKQNSARLNFCPIKADIAAKNGTISCRDEQFYIRIKVAEGMPLPKDMSINVKDGNKLNETVKVVDGYAEVKCKGIYNLLQESKELNVNLKLAADPVVEDEGLMFYVYWLEVESKRIDLRVTNEFQPSLTVKLI